MLLLDNTRPPERALRGLVGIPYLEQNIRDLIFQVEEFV